MRVTIFSTGGEILPCFDFYVVTRSCRARSYALLAEVMQVVGRTITINIIQAATAWLVSHILGHFVSSHIKVGSSALHAL